MRIDYKEKKRSQKKKQEKKKENKGPNLRDLITGKV